MDTTSRVLIVEDSAAQAAVIAALVQQLGFTPVVYTELKAGIIEILLKEQPQLVLLDLMLLDAQGRQVADGFKICREIKRFRSDLPVVVVTAEGDDQACEWALLQGADAYLQKPFAPEDLTQVVEAVLGGG